MKREVCSAVDFLTQLMRPSASEKTDNLGDFNDILKRRISEHYMDHWFPEKPFKGSGYRCLRINHNMEPIILQAAAESGLTRDDLMSMLPNELTLWIDPREVSYRIGEDGSVGILYAEEQDSHNNNAKKHSSRPSSSTSTVTSTSSDVSWPFYEPTLSPNLSPRHHYPQQQCKDVYLHHSQANLNDAYDLKRLAAFVYS